MEKDKKPTANRPFVLKKWNGVAMWSWDVECDTCAICRVPLMDSCLRCQSECKAEECVIVWGECNHSYHNCCLAMWVKQNNRCPLCQQEWQVARMNLDPDAQADVMVQMAAQEDEEEEDGDQTPMEMGLSAEVIEEINRKKKAMPNMFVSGFEADDDGVEKNVDDPVEEFLTAAEEGDVMKVKSMMEGASAKGELRELFAMHDDDGYTALHRSAYNDHREVVKMLLEAGEDPMAVTNDGWTPLHTAAYWANPQIVGLLLSTGKVDVNARTNGGLVPLHLAINANSERSPDDVLETVQYLLAAPGVNASARNGAGDTPFALARRSSRQLTEMGMDLELLQFIDANVLEKPARVVRSAKPVCDPPAMDRIEKLRFRLSGALNALQQGGISDAQASVNEHILSMLKYKYSNPNKHMKFWTNLKKLHAQVKKLDAGGLKQSIRRLEDAVSVGSMYYTPTPEYLTYIGCLLLNRLYRLDRIRITAAKMAFVSMGYIDIGNWMTLNLLLVAVASDIAKDCLGQMIELSLIYNELASNLREGSERLPENVGVLRFESVKGGLIKNALSIEQPDANLLGTITYVLEISDEELVANYKSRLQEAARYDRASLIKSLNIAPEEGASGKAVEDDDEISTIGAEEENGDSAEEPDNENTVTVPKKKKKPKAKLVKALKKVIAKKKLKKKAKKEA